MKFIIKNSQHSDDRKVQEMQEDEEARNQEEKLAVDAEGNLSAYNPNNEHDVSGEGIQRFKRIFPEVFEKCKGVLEERVGLESKLRSRP